MGRVTLMCAIFFSLIQNSFATSELEQGSFIHFLQEVVAQKSNLGDDSLRRFSSDYLLGSLFQFDFPTFALHAWMNNKNRTQEFFDLLGKGGVDKIPSVYDLLVAISINPDNRGQDHRWWELSSDIRNRINQVAHYTTKSHGKLESGWDNTSSDPPMSKALQSHPALTVMKHLYVNRTLDKYLGVDALSSDDLDLMWEHVAGHITGNLAAVSEHSDFSVVTVPFTTKDQTHKGNSLLKTTVSLIGGRWFSLYHNRTPGYDMRKLLQFENSSVSGRQTHLTPWFKRHIENNVTNARERNEIRQK